MTIVQAIWLGIGIGVLVFLVIAWLKGAFGLAVGLAREMARRFSHEGGEPWTIAVAGEPLVAAVTVFFVVAFGLANPDSRWARWFYGDRRMAKARERYEQVDPSDCAVG